MPIGAGARAGVQAEADSPFLSGAGCFRARALPCPSYGLRIVRPSDGMRRSRHRELLVHQIPGKRGANEALSIPEQDGKGQKEIEKLRKQNTRPLLFTIRFVPLR